MGMLNPLMFLWLPLILGLICGSRPEHPILWGLLWFILGFLWGPSIHRTFHNLFHRLFARSQV